MKFFQVPESVTSRSGYQYIHCVLAPGHREGQLGQTIGMYDANFLSVAENGEGSVRPQEVTTQGSSRYYEPLHPAYVYPETLTLNQWRQRHNIVDIIQHFPVNSLIQVPHSTHSCHFQPEAVNGHVQYPGLTKRQYLPTTELYNTRGQMIYQPTVHIQQQQQHVPIMNQIPPGHVYPNNFSWTHHVIQAKEKMKPPNARKSLASFFNTQDASQGSQTTMTNMTSMVTPVEYRADLHTHMDSGSKMSHNLTKSSKENLNSKDSSMCGTRASNTIQQNVPLDDPKHFFRWGNKKNDPSSKPNSDGSKPAIFLNKDDITLLCEQLLPCSKTLLSSRDICTDFTDYTIVPTISPGVSSNTKNKNVQKRSAKYILGSFAKDLLSSDYEDPEVSLLISSMDYLYQDTAYGDIQSKTKTSRSAPHSTSKPLAKWYSIFKKRRLCRLKAKTAKHKKSDGPQKKK